MASNIQDERKVADPERERHALELFRMTLSADEYAARNAHLWMAFSFDDYRYSNPKLDDWITRLGDILFRRHGAPTPAELRERYLTVEERERIRREQ